jgi:beta-glucanase (GH16 family)
MKLNLLVLLGLFFISSCNGDEGEEEVTLPKNLTVTIEIDDQNAGEVTVQAIAENANFYTISFGVGRPITTASGTAVYTYQNSGTYTITVNAHATAAAFITETKSVTVTLPGGSDIPTIGNTSPLTYEGMNLVWQDEFDGSELNPLFWNFEIGIGSNGWGNNELEYYREENTEVRDGHLIINAKKETFGGREYTSSRITTKAKKEFKYGRIDIRALVPKGQGIWPALWMLGSDISDVGWPKCGETDIMEMIGGSNRENTVYATLHWYDENSSAADKHASYGGNKTLSSGTFSDKFYVYSIDWTETYIKWYIDGALFHTTDITPGSLSEFHKNYFFIFNVAVGGNWPENPDGTTIFPQRMIVDYVRVFQKN